MVHRIATSCFKGRSCGGQPVGGQQVVGKGMPERHGLGLEPATHLKNAEPVVLEMGIEPFDELSAPVDVLSGGAVHSAAPRLYAVGFFGPLPCPSGQRLWFDVIALGRERSID